MITNERDYLKNRHYVLIEIYSDPDKTTFIKYEGTTKESNAVLTGIAGNLLEHLKLNDIIDDYAISDI